jgi:hypothetical protein
MLPGGHYTQYGTYPNRPMGEGWANFMKNARPSANIEDYRRTRGKPFIVQ